MENKKRIGILGGGPSGLFMFKRLVDTGRTDFTVTIFDKKSQLGVGMPYSAEGANAEHITNVSGNEIPALVTTIEAWIATASKSMLNRFNITPEIYNDYKVLPRLLFGQYLAAQFDLLQQRARQAGITTQIHYNSTVTDMIDYPDQDLVRVVIDGEAQFEFDQVIICTGHVWPCRYEGTVPGYFDTPYPPSKLGLKLNHPVAIKGSSLTAIDALRTLARHNGEYQKNKEGKLVYTPAAGSEHFRMVMHSRNGLLPAIRFHLEDPHLSKDDTLTKAEMQQHRAENGGFMSLDYLFEHNFKEMFREKRPEFYEQIKGLSMEDFVTAMMDQRECRDPFELFKAEYVEAAKSIEQRRSVYWKEVLAVLSFSMNYPAKYLSAEDMQRLKKVLMPLISIVIAFVPQASCEELFALHQAGILSIVSVGDDSYTEPADQGATYHYTDEAGAAQKVHYRTYIDCVGQPHLAYEELPFQSLIDKKTVSPAMLKFADAETGKKQMAEGNDDVTTDRKGDYYLKVPGITINDVYQVVDEYGALNERIYMMAVPYIGGFNPDYSGLDFGDAASACIIKGMYGATPAS